MVNLQQGHNLVFNSWPLLEVENFGWSDSPTAILEIVRYSDDITTASSQWKCTGIELKVLIVTDSVQHSLLWLNYKNKKNFSLVNEKSYFWNIVHCIPTNLKVIVSCDIVGYFLPQANNWYDGLWCNLVTSLCCFVAAVFVALGLTAVIPATHFVIADGLSHAFNFGGFWFLVLIGFLYLFGAVMYAARVPECLYPGLFDIWVKKLLWFHTMYILNK